MSLPTAYDGKLAEIENLHCVVKIQLGKMHRGGWVSTTEGYKRTDKSSPSDRSDLRDRLQAYVNHVMALADEIGGK